MNVVLKLSKLCNLRCTYCYEYEHLANPARMPITGLAHFFRSLAEWLDTQDQRVRIEVALHGGEPLLLPVDYLTQVMTSQAPLRNAGHPVRNTVQSNLYRMRQETLRWLETFDVGLGVSIDVDAMGLPRAAGTCRLRACATAVNLTTGARVRSACELSASMASLSRARSRWRC